MTEYCDLSGEERQAMSCVEAQGGLSSQLYREGDFSEPDFILFGVLERLVIRQRLIFLGRSGDDRNATYSYGPAQASNDALKMVRAA